MNLPVTCLRFTLRPFALIALFAAGGLFAQSAGSITGRASNAGTRQYLEDVELTLSPLGQTALTGRDGRYVFRNVPPGTYQISAVYSGLQPETTRVTVPAGEAYVPIEGPRGEHGFSIYSDGTNRPYRIKLRAPSFYACQGLPRLIVGGMIADVIAVIGSTDVVMGDVDR